MLHLQLQPSVVPFLRLAPVLLVYTFTAMFSCSLSLTNFSQVIDSLLEIVCKVEHRVHENYVQASA